MAAKTPLNTVLKALLRKTVAALALLALLWVLGLGWFIHDARRPPPPATPCDGIVALTGGESRIETSLTLLQNRYGKLLLISGVAPHTTLSQLLRLAPQTLPTETASKITLGHRATSTIGNAHETATWATEHNLHSLLVVTSGYHMRRALIELRRTAPTLTFIPYPVLPPSLHPPLTHQTLHLLIREYLKFLGAELSNLTGLPDGTIGLTSR